MTIVLPTTKIRERLGAVLDQLKSKGGPIYITRRGRTQAVLLTPAEYESLVKRDIGTEESWYAISQSSLASVWDHPAEDIYTVADGEPV